MSNGKKDESAAVKTSLLSKVARIIAIFVLILVLVIFTGLFMVNKNKELSDARKDLMQFDNVEEEIFDVSEDAVAKDDKIDLQDYDINDRMLKQVVMANSNKLKDFYQKLEVFEQGFARFESSIKIQQAIISYVKFREKLYQNQEFDLHLQNFKLLVVENKGLTKKVRELEKLLSNFKGFVEIKDDFRDLIVDLTAMKKHDPKSGALSKIRFSFAKLISVRRLDQFDQSIDGFIYRVNNHLEEQNCDAINDEIEKVEQKYQERLSSFKASIARICEIKAIDGEIFEVLEELSS